jgi:MoaA/NifB/PqqE/SkfB family radical SAM enzyme
MTIKENKTVKMFRSENYNFNFNKSNGYFERWGKTKNDDPDFSAYGPEILDLEISTSVRPEDKHLYDESRLVNDGGCLGSCSFCYKSNGRFPTYNMTLEEFKKIFHAMPKTMTQIAFGILNVKTNPDFFKMMEYAKENGVIPNYTCHGFDVSKEVAKKTASLCGAVAVSVYNKNASYDAIKKFTDAGMDQVNIHYMIAEETYDRAFKIIDDMKSDNRLYKMNAIVFLSLKQKGGGEGFTRLSTEKYNKLVQYALDKEVRFGFDSCGAHKFLNAVKDHKNYEQFEMMAEPCESSCFSSYINSKGEYFACSFAEGHDLFKKGIDVLNTKDFVKDVWYGDDTKNFRKVLLDGKRHCPLYII